MGNTEISPSTTSSSALNHFSKRFIISPHPLDTDQSLMFYMHEKLSNNKYILRILSTNDSEQKQKIQDLICKKLAMTKNNNKIQTNIIPIDHYIFEQDKGYCNSYSKCYLLFNPNNSQPLTHYLARGHYNQNLQKIINQDIIYKGLLNLIEGIALLKYYNQPHRHINCDTIYYNKQNNTFILADPWISPLTDLHQQYHSPQKLKQIKNQIEKHDPYLSDLFSIGMVGLKMLGNNNLIDYYSIHKNIDQPGLLKLTNTIKNNKLQNLIIKLLSENIQVRDQVLNQTKLQSSSSLNLNANSNSRKDLNQNLTKTRQLSGKVASVRKSFINDDRTIARFHRNSDVNNIPKQVSNDIQGNFYNNKTIQTTQFNPFSKNKGQNNFNLNPYQNKNQNQSYGMVNQIKTQQVIKKPSVNDKPEIDVGFTTFSPLISQQTTKVINRTNSARINFTTQNPVPVQPNINYQPVKFTSITPTTTYLNTYTSTTNPPYFSSQPNNYSNNNFKIPNNNSYSSLLNSNSDKFLKNVSSTPIPYQNSTQFGTIAGSLDFSMSQKVLQNQTNQTNRNQLVSINKAPSLSTTFPNPIQTNKKQQPLSSSILKKQLKINQVSPMTNVSISSPANTIKQHIKSQKQDLINPLRTNPSYPSSDSFESDHINQNKIYQNLRNLQNKISQAINASRFNMTQNSRISNNISALNLQSSGRLIESVIVPRQQDTSSNNSTVKVINQQFKQSQQPQQTIKQPQKISKQQKQTNTNNTTNNRQLQQIQKIQKYDKLSPILVRQRQSQNSPIQDTSQRLSDQQLLTSNQQSVDFLNINSSKQNSSQQKQNKLSQQQQSEQQQSHRIQQQKQQDVVQTPAKNPNIVRLQGNNLTIPEQSDQQSFQGQGERQRYKGQYVQQVYENGGKYVGYMLNDQRNGNGIFYYRDGGYYDGRWKQNMMNGYGKLYYQTGKLAYQGQWYQDQFHGRGTVYNDQPQAVPQQGFDYKNMNESQTYWQYYQGDLSHDMKARYGKLMLSNGQYYQGQFKNDQVHGKGQFHKYNGNVIKGIWSQGILIRQI